MKPPYLNISDPHSFSEPALARVTHLDLTLDVDFENKTTSGFATYTVIQEPGASEIILDTRGLIIQKVKILDQEVAFLLKPEDAILGQALHIPIIPETAQITIYYKTSSKAAALQWLNPTQTAGKVHPFLFTQSQAILARTWIPCQDSPSVRFTYNATIQVPPTYLALMSAENPQVKSGTGSYVFKQDHPIPAYLMALAIGDLAFTPLNERTGVYAEPNVLAAAVHEFAQLPEMLQAAENIYGAYPWGRYDLLLLPPSFPFGGMENPMLTFVTPTIIAGDRSLTSLVAHELAHSWSGNLVTNATWNDFWLNEGFTVYFERRIMEALQGKEYADMLKVLGYQDLVHTINDIGPHQADTCLKLNLTNRDPDEGLTEIAYEKGNYFLLTIEQVVGREKFDSFVLEYFKENAFQSMDTERFLKVLREKLLSQHPNFETLISPEKWIYEPGLPEYRLDLKATRFDSVDTAVTNWKKNGNPAQLETQNWTTHEWLYFLNKIKDDLSLPNLKTLDEAFNFTHFRNAEILSIWLEQTIKLTYEPAKEALELFLTTVGRRKFILPLYKALKNKDPQLARDIYARARPNYHAVATVTLDALMFT